MTIKDKEKDKEVAKKGCDGWLTKCVAGADKALGECLVLVGMGKKKKEDCLKQYERLMRRCARIHQKNLESIDKAYEENVIVAGQSTSSDLPPVA